MRLNSMRLAGLAVLVAFAGPAVAFAQQASQSAATQTCVDVRIGNDRAAYLDCLNADLKRRAVREQNAPQPTVPYDTHSPTNEIGGYNVNAAHEQMGNAFGVSSHPQRPTTTFVNPLLGH